ncbi:aspartyl protease [Ureibacillus xyleni]|uniref:Aspartyl protease n=1 Tax=Ureibacillus xyleni TaxID=614648 RepID=A0A285SD98_9BACL|nr:retropepsin-like aspartic protease [Ureibacillus xyleni]SOC05506.1 aspartyl protease [Ureibacillus xyleni]
MKQLILDRGLLLTDMEVEIKGKVLTLNRVLIDTGSATTMISSDLAASFGILAEPNDPIYRIYGVGGFEFVFSKIADTLKVGDQRVHHIPIEFGDMDYGFSLDGILGINVLKQMNAVININNLSIQYPQNR